MDTHSSQSWGCWQLVGRPGRSSRGLTERGCAAAPCQESPASSPLSPQSPEHNTKRSAREAALKYIRSLITEGATGGVSVQLPLCCWRSARQAGSLFETYLLCCEKRLLSEAGDDDGVHVQLLPQLLIVRQLRRNIVFSLAREQNSGREINRSAKA